MDQLRLCTCQYSLSKNTKTKDISNIFILPDFLSWYKSLDNRSYYIRKKRKKRRLTLFGHLVRMDESTDARRILTAVPQSEWRRWRRPVGRPYTSWMATLKNDLAQHNLSLEDAIELALNKPLWRLLAASGATHWWCMPNNDDDDDDIRKYDIICILPQNLLRY